MKKNKMMRIASVLLVMTLLSTCAISGTFAKYVTKVSGTDNARVAKWGIVLTMEAGNVFASEYQTHDKAAKEAGIAVSVQAKAGEATEGQTAPAADKLVAPGTSSKDIVDENGEVIGGIKASVKGTPEVATRYSLTIAGLKDVVLPKGEKYVDYTELVKADDGTYGYTNTFDLAKDYAPVKWDMTINGKSLAKKLLAELSSYATQLAAYGLTEDGCSFHDAVAIINKVNSNDTYKQAVENVLKSIIDGANFQIVVDETAGTVTLSYDVKPNVPMNYEAELNWKWAFEQEDVELFDKADTYLGNLAAGIDGIVKPEGASTEIAATLTATATQID